MMKFDELYEKLNSLVAFELFDYESNQKALETEFVKEFLYLNNMSLDVFKKESAKDKFGILRIYDVYFRNGKPLIDDASYDTLYKIYEPTSNKPQKNVMFEPSLNAWEKADHIIPMGSLDKQTTTDEIEKWNLKKGVNGKSILVSEKLDGISLEAVFEKGKFVRAITRGDGKKGDDITQNAKYFDGMVNELTEPWDCAIRGEVVITKQNLNKINEILVSNGKDPLKNTRNGVAGLATKFKDRNEEILSLITFIAYDLQVFDVHATGENVI